MPSSSSSASTTAFGPTGGKPEIEATDDAMGHHMVDDMHRANVDPGSGGRNDLNHGIHYWYNYKTQCEWAHQPWNDAWRHGHTQAEGFVQPHENGQFMTWQLKPGSSASKGIKDWLAGATVAECNSSVVAMEIDTLRAAIGDKKFDKLFGSADATEDKAIPQYKRMVIHPGKWGTPVENYLEETQLAKDAGAQGEFGSVEPARLDKELIPGQWYYFYNHPKYLLKHPGGAWQGENSLYMGKNEAGERTWAGLGASGMTEDGMIGEMVSAYNQARDDKDDNAMKEDGIVDDAGKYRYTQYDPTSGVFPDTVTKDDIIKSQAFDVGGTTRKGGFMATAGQALNADKVKNTRDAP